MTELMTTKEVADYLRTSSETVRYWRHQGTGPPAAKVGRRVVYRRADVEEWLNRKFQEQTGREAS